MRSDIRARTEVVPEGTRTEGDDFFCQKYRVWYRVEDCVYRGRNKTYSGCVNCLQGYLNIRSLEKGVRPPVVMGSQRPARSGSGPGTLHPLKRTSDNGKGS